MKLKVYLTLGAVVLSLCLAMLVYGQTQKNAVTRPTWEYKVIILNRSAESNAPYTIWQEVSADGATTLTGPVSGVAKMSELGNQGWELVAVVPISNNAGGFSPDGRGSSDIAGFTSQLNYYFKRPK